MTTVMATPTQSWWWWQRPRKRLVKWAHALLQGRRYTVLVKPFHDGGRPGTGFRDGHKKLIQANPQYFRKQEVRTQFRATQAILGHEVGHAFFTDAWPEGDDQQTLRWLVNVLEDERIERALSVYYPGVAPLFDLLGDLFYEQTEPLSRRCDEPAQIALACCLSWRWAKKRADQTAMFHRLGIGDEKAIDLWDEIKPLVEGAWIAADTTAVIEIAQDILAILDLPEGHPLPALPIFQLGLGEGIPEDREGDPLPFPAAPFEGDSPGVGGEIDESLPTPSGDTSTQPAPFAALEQAAAPLARQLVAALKVPRPNVRPTPHQWRGRYSFRQEVRTPARPHLQKAAVGKDKDDVAIYVLVDRSGSMTSVEGPVRLALMTIYLAATELGIPLGMAFFGDDSDYDADDFVLEVSPLRSRSSEETKSLIAGFRGATSKEFLDWGLALVEETLRYRSERRKIVLVIHDGQPVYVGGLGNDMALSLQRLRQLERQGLTPIGLYLGQDYNPALKELFPRLVISGGGSLPEKLGNMIRSLV